MKTFNQILLDFMQSKKPDELRLGQHAFNFIHDIEPDIANEIRGTDKDCFYSNDKMSEFLEEVNKLYNQKYNL
jgi:hypothetical protein